MRILICLSLAVMAVALLDGFAFPAYADEGCPAGYRKVGEDVEQTANETILHARCKRIAEKGSSEKAQFCKAEGLITHDQEGLRSLDFETDVEQYEKFQEISKDQKAEFEHKAFDAALDQGLEIAGKGVDAAKSLNPWNVNNAIKELKAKGFVNEKVMSAMRRVAAVKDKPAKAAAYKEFIEDLKAAHQGVDTGIGMAKEPQTAELQLLLGALKVVQGNPELGLVVTTAEFGESFAYLYYLNGQVAEKDALVDQKLATLAKLGKNLKTHVDDMKKAKAAWSKASGKNDEPVCAQ